MNCLYGSKYRQLVSGHSASHQTTTLQSFLYKEIARFPCGPNWQLEQARSEHIDQVSQYTSVSFGKRCTEAGVRPSMGSVGDAYDNALTESFFSTLEAELLSRRRFASQAEAKMACFSYIEGWYNPVRLHSALEYRSPIAYEANMQTAEADT